MLVWCSSMFVDWVFYIFNWTAQLQVIYSTYHNYAAIFAWDVQMWIYIELLPKNIIPKLVSVSKTWCIGANFKKSLSSALKFISRFRSWINNFLPEKLRIKYQSLLYFKRTWSLNSLWFKHIHVLRLFGFFLLSHPVSWLNLNGRWLSRDAT